MNFDFTEMETLILEKAVKMVLEYNRHCLKKEKEEDQKAMWKAEIRDLNIILKKLQEKLD